MKINPIGIDAYRQTMDKAQVADKQAARNGSAAETDKVQIPAQTNKAGSKLGVRLESGTFVDMLSEEEKQALDMVFSKFRNIASSYNREGSSDKNLVGNFVDVKL